MIFRRILLTLCAALALPVGLIAQRTPPGQSPDNVVTLLSAQSAELMEVRGKNVRKVVGPARFYHNKTYLICDTAYWHVEDQLIQAIGHVKIVQNRTQLTSETLDYVVEEDLAKFRGLVQLEDKDNNVLRTKYLDYNTKDSVAVFQNGGAMKSKDGQVIESRFGSYESKIKTFTFMDNVQMFTDTTLIKTSRLVFNSETNIATFGYGTDAWNGDNMLSSNDGWFDRGKDWFFFRKNVHIMTRDREGWSDSLLFKRPISEVEMLGNAQVLDTTRSVRALAGRIFYQDTLSRVTMTRRPAIISLSEEKDTVLFGADTLIHQGIPRCEIDSMEVVLAKKRLEDLAGDPIAEHRRKAAEAAAKAAEEAAKDDPNRPPDLPRPADKSAAAKTPDQVRGDGGTVRGRSGSSVIPRAESPSVSPPDSLSASTDTLSAPLDSLGVPLDSLGAPLDSLAAGADSLAAAAPAPKDSTKIDFVRAWGRVKLFRKDTQMACDSLAYNGLDSLVRIYKNPFVYQEGTRQYTSDSIYVAIRGKAIDKASLMSNAFILIQEDTTYYDQIKGAEMLAYFDTTGALRRFDGLGGSIALFYLQENNAIATANKVEAKMLSATFRDGDLDRILYFESAKNDAYPVVQLPAEEQRMKGFNWQPDLRPTGLHDLTDLKPRDSERKSYASHAKPDYPLTETYFPGYMKQAFKDMEDARHRPKKTPDQVRGDGGTIQSDGAMTGGEGAVAEGDGTAAGGEGGSLGTSTDGSPVIPGSEGASGSPSDTTGVKTTDGSSVIPGSGGASVSPSSSSGGKTKSTKEDRKAEKERLKAEKQAAREARWAELDARDAAKAEAKKQKKLDKKRKATLRALQREAARAAREKALYEKYLRHYQDKEAKNIGSPDVLRDPMNNK